jgi:hypothetical protein
MMDRGTEGAQGMHLEKKICDKKIMMKIMLQAIKME